MKIYPMLLRPVYKEYIWGGDRIADAFHRTDIPQKVAESWEVADHRDGMSVVENGAYKGLALHDLVERYSKELIGRELQKFPLLLKIIDAKESLSIQVHPDERVARSLGSEPKTEMWYLLGAQKSAVLLGFKRGVTLNQYQKAQKESTVAELMEEITLDPGEVVYVPAGTPHAILKGALLFEIQQNSNTTYRIYDWGRDREIHLEEAEKALHFGNNESDEPKAKRIKEANGIKIEELLTSNYFCLRRYEIQGTYNLEPIKESFQILFILSGEMDLELKDGSTKVKEGRSVLIPADAKEIRCVSSQRRVTFLQVSLR